MMLARKLTRMLRQIIFSLFAAVLTVPADETLPVLKVKDEIYTNVTITTVTATDISFMHSRGIGNAKLKNLSPELQKYFRYDEEKSVQKEQEQAQANSEFRKTLADQKPTRQPATNSEKQISAADDFVAPQLHARSYRGHLAPTFVVEKWIAEPSDITGKFLLIDFWATWCGPCRASIPELNAFHAKYKDRLVVIGVSDETERDVRKMTKPKIDYAVAIDTQQRMMRPLEIRGIPHCILVDPNGIVRYEGMPQYLNDQRLEHFLEKYSK